MAAIVLSAPPFARAQEASAPDSVEPPATPDAASVIDEAWLLYDRAFERLVAGQADRARALLVQLVERFPGHPSLALARRRVAEIDVRSANTTGQPADASGASPIVPSDPLAERPTGSARAEFALSMILHGVLAGNEVCRVAECDSDRALSALYILGGGAGLAGSLYLTRGGITPGNAQLISSAASWGLWNGLGLNDGFAEDSGEAGVQLASQAIGLAAGVGLWYVWHPTSGDVSLANTVGSWSAILTTLGQVMLDRDFDLASVVLVSDAGLLLGGVLSSYYPMSRSRTLLIDAGGVLGALFGGLVGLSTTDGDEEELVRAVFGGTLVGLIGAGVITHGWDAPTPLGARVGLAPMGRAGWGATVSLDLDL